MGTDFSIDTSYWGPVSTEVSLWSAGFSRPWEAVRVKREEGSKEWREKALSERLDWDLIHFSSSFACDSSHLLGPTLVESKTISGWLCLSICSHMVKIKSLVIRSNKNFKDKEIFHHTLFKDM